ncbi:MAG: ATP-binding protein [Clostridia bacterium]|nr:ATP-binding protein [Clostridia bacterium]MBQ4365238.1 ATP-binding protein [Clostridia bacterium]MBQ6092631.1 ATP-binding protein [Clostridia bacterium]MBR3095268.1 ATP-binding protein [Clostridia bacterium]
MMESIKLHYDVSGVDFTRAGAASGDVKRVLKQLGVSPVTTRNVAVAMYEAEINMVIHAGGGEIDVEITEDAIRMVLQDHGPGIENVELAMKEGYSTAPDNIRSLGFGAGMGLPNIKKYSDEFRLETELGVGTTLYLTVYMK